MVGRRLVRDLCRQAGQAVSDGGAQAGAAALQAVQGHIHINNNDKNKRLTPHGAYLQ